MDFRTDKYYGYIIKGELKNAMNYLRQFPEKNVLYHRFSSIFEHEQYVRYDVNEKLNQVLLAYQRYYRDVFYLLQEKKQAEKGLQERLKNCLGLVEKEIELYDMEQNQLVALFAEHGLHFLGGKTSGYYGPYIWRTTETVSYQVALPSGMQSYFIKFLDGFLTKSWVDYLSFGEIGSGGWSDGDGYINCVQSAWNVDSESFRVSLLKHEAQHAQDLKRNPQMSSENLEYRAKLVELMYSTERKLLPVFAQEADASDKNNGHAMASYKILENFANTFGVEGVALEKIPVEQVQRIARTLFESSLS